MTTFATTMKDYCSESGQIINYEKSQIFFSPKTGQDSINEVITLLNVHQASSLNGYLGVDLDTRPSRTQNFQVYVDKIIKRIHSWSAKLVNFGGRVTLIKFVLQSILVYPMSVFKFPLATLNEIDKLMANFLWGGTARTKIHWINWEFLHLGKDKGGLELKQLHHFNLALIANRSWKLFTNPNSPAATLLRSKYYPNSSPFKATKPSNESGNWRSIKAGLTELKKNVIWDFKSGDEIDIWADRWLQANDYKNLEAFKPTNTELSKVQDLISPNGEWDCETLYRIFPGRIATAIAQLGITEEKDSINTILSKVSTKGIYKEINNGEQTRVNIPERARSHRPRLWQRLWKLPLPNKIKFFMWKLLLNKLPTKDKLASKTSILIPKECSFCINTLETATHLFLDFPFTRSIWGRVNLLTSGNTDICTAICPIILRNWKRETEYKDEVILLGFTLWSVWTHRNETIFREEVISREAVLGKRRVLMEDWFRSERLRRPDGDRKILNTNSKGTKQKIKLLLSLSDQKNFLYIALYKSNGSCSTSDTDE